jgi:cobalt-zinc-cadmium resistance protein CzcA
MKKSNLSLEISKVYNHIVYLQNQEKLYFYLDSLYQNFSKASNRRFELGETNYLEKITAQAKFRQKQAYHKLKVIRAHIMTCCIH